MKSVKVNRDWYECAMATVKAFKDNPDSLKRLSEKYPLSLWRCAYEITIGKIVIEIKNNKWNRI